MKLAVVIDTKYTHTHNALGEILRNDFFKQDEESLGCYTTFEFRSDVEEMPSQPVPTWEFNDDGDEMVVSTKNSEYHFTCAKKNGIKMLYFWNGDGFLSFILPDGTYLINTDCKKDYTWELYPSIESYWHSGASL